MIMNNENKYTTFDNLNIVTNKYTTFDNLNIVTNNVKITK